MSTFEITASMKASFFPDALFRNELGGVDPDLRGGRLLVSLLDSFRAREGGVISGTKLVPTSGAMVLELEASASSGPGGKKPLEESAALMSRLCNLAVSGVDIGMKVACQGFVANKVRKSRRGLILGSQDAPFSLVNYSVRLLYQNVTLEC